ncbi:hypothetical protein [Streptomyces sp. NPDC001536]|uniref:hypothetical protein n=1 Tax=Streptomyces sp. NPDC001536 TaxID=3364583 RepID=UPI003679801D
MRPLYVPVRLAATVMAVAAAAGCMSVGDDDGGKSAKPSHSAGQRGGEAPDGGSAVSGGGDGYGVAGADGKHGKKKGKGKAGESASPSASESAGESASPSADVKPGKTDKPQPTPTKPPPTPTKPPEPTPTPTPTPDPPSPTPTAAEPSSSAHPGTEPQLTQREPAPAAGTPA